jgi:hypothetical protein
VHVVGPGQEVGVLGADDTHPFTGLFEAMARRQLRRDPGVLN